MAGVIKKLLKKFNLVRSVPKFKVYLEEIPETCSVAFYLNCISRFCDWQIEPRASAKVIVLDKLEIDYPCMIEAVYDARARYGDHGWLSEQGRSDFYTGFSLTYNPEHLDAIDPHASTLGTARNDRNDFYYWQVKNHAGRIRDSYFDTYGFCHRTPASKIGELGRFLNRINRTLVRSRVAILHGENFRRDEKPKFGWHRDESVYEMLRLNIPVLTSENYLFQIEGESPRYFESGYGYTWDTNQPHRVFADNFSADERINLVIGVSPWWDYDAKERAWVSNEFFGLIHPFDMLAEGKVLKHVRLRKDVTFY